MKFVSVYLMHHAVRQTLPQLGRNHVFFSFFFFFFFAYWPLTEPLCSGCVNSKTAIHGCKCCLLTSDPAKHAIPKTAEVAYSIGVGELDWQYGTGLKSHGTVTNWCIGRVTCELHDGYFRSMTIKHAIPKTAEVHIPMASYEKRLSGRWTII